MNIYGVAVIEEQEIFFKKGDIMLIKLSSLKSELKHSDDFNQEIKNYLKLIEQEISLPINITTIDDYDCDLKLIFIETGGSEGLFLSAIDKLQEPYYLLTSGGNNSLAASLEILSYLQANDKKGEILHGSVQYIGERILSLCSINRAYKSLHQTTLGVVGKPSDWLISSVPNYQQVQEKIGVNLIDVPLSEIEEYALKPHFNNFNLENYKFDKNEIQKAMDISSALDAIVSKYNLKGLTIRCFDLLKSIKNTGCLGLAHLNEKGIIGTCEGDVMAMLSMCILHELTGKSSFQANPSRIDPIENEIVFAHCTIPFDMVEEYTLDTHFESGIGVAVKGKLKETRITVFRLSSDLKRYYLSQGSILENMNESNLCRTQIRVKMDDSVESLLTHPCGNHHIIVYGEHKGLVEEFMKLLK